MKNEIAPTQTNFFGSIKHFFKNIAEQLKSSQYLIIEIAIAFGLGFLFGFMVKRFANYVVAFVLFIIGLIILQQLEIIVISFNMLKIEEIFGIKQVPMGADFFSACWIWIKLNAALTISFIIGLVLGLKLA